MKPTCCLKLLGCLFFTFLSATAGISATPGPMAAADALLQSPTLDMAQAEKALNLYAGLLSSNTAPRPLVLAQLSRTCFILGELAPKKYCEGYFRKGKVYADILIQEDPYRVEGHYWLALNLCGLAEACGYLTGRRLLPQIMEELERALVLDETYDQAGAHRVLGRIYSEAPAWPMSVGDLHKSLEHLKAAVRLTPNNSTNRLYLAQTLYRMNYRALARQELEMVLKCTQHAVKPKDIEEDHQEARRLLADFGG
ncbi:MAG: tetratricopeptide repeat protein [Thermodesulfobacteriota bacterium]